NPNGSALGLPLKLGGPGTGAAPSKFVPVGKRRLSSPTSTVPNVPACDSVCLVEPSHQSELTGLKSPGVESLVRPLLGSDPGATNTWHVYCPPRSKTVPLMSALDWPGSTGAYQSGEVISAWGGTLPGPA